MSIFYYLKKTLKREFSSVVFVGKLKLSFIFLSITMQRLSKGNFVSGFYEKKNTEEGTKKAKKLIQPGQPLLRPCHNKKTIIE